MAADLIGATLLSRTREERDFPIPDQPEVSIGYDRSNDVPVSFEGVSRRHARISFDGKDYWIEDVGSANGTFLNAIRLARKERLKHLDIVTLGRRADLIFVRRSVDVARQTRRGIQAARLEVLDGLEAGTRREIPRGSVTIGRANGNNIVADSQLVSKVHARIERGGLQMLLTDLQSANGTFVNDEKIDSRILKDGDVISVGHARSYRVRIEEGEVLTGDVPLSDIAEAAKLPSLPLDWKTHMEWSPEEAALIDRARAAMRPPAPAAPAAPPKPAKPGPAAPAPKAAAAAPASKPPAKPAVVPAAARPAAEAAKPAAESEPAPPPSVPAPPAPSKPQPKPEAPAPAPPQPAASAKPAPPAAPAPPQQPPPAKPAAPSPVAAPPVAPPPTPAPKAAPPASAVAPVPQPPPTVQPPVPESFDPDATRALAPAEALAPRIFLESTGRTYPLAVGVHEIGREPAAGVHLDGLQISRRHATLRVTDTEAVLEDLKTVNGTFVNQQRLTAPRVLAEGDVVAFGNTVFRIRFAPGFPAAAPEKPKPG